MTRAPRLCCNFVPYSNDGLAAGAEFTGHGSDGMALRELLAHYGHLPLVEALRSPYGLARRLGEGQSGLGPFDQLIPLEFGYCGDDAHGHFSCRACQVNPAQREAMNPNSGLCEFVHCGANVHGIAP